MLVSVERPMIKYVRRENEFNSHFIPISILVSAFTDYIITGNWCKDYKLCFLSKVESVMSVTLVNEIIFVKIFGSRQMIGIYYQWHFGNECVDCEVNLILESQFHYLQS